MAAARFTARSVTADRPSPSSRPMASMSAVKVTRSAEQNLSQPERDVSVSLSRYRRRSSIPADDCAHGGQVVSMDCLVACCWQSAGSLAEVTSHRLPSGIHDGAGAHLAGAVGGLSLGLGTVVPLIERMYGEA